MGAYKKHIECHGIESVLMDKTGDFSFARSLVIQHKCRNVLATCYDSKDELHAKYPQVEGNVRDIYSAGSSSSKHKRMGQDGSASGQDEDGDGNAEQGQGQDQDQDQAQEKENSKNNQNNRYGPRVLYSIDARKLGHTTAGGGKDIRTGLMSQREQRRRQQPVWKQQQQKKTKNKGSYGSQAFKGGPWDIICFNFPHVGGLSTDVNRQVRANQELLVAFFKACVPLLSTPSPDAHWDDSEEDYDWEGASSSNDSDSTDPEQKTRSKPRTEPGQILVTLFEGEPYTLWNIRDLARHAGLKVVTSFRFPWASYEGYTHARTLGHIEGKQGGGGRGGWKGEDREARMYVFEVKREDNRGMGMPARNPHGSSGNANKKKRARDDGSDSGGSD